MKKLLCLFLACISVTFFCSCDLVSHIGVGLFSIASCVSPKKPSLLIKEGRFIYICQGEFITAENINATYNDYYGEIDVKEITKEEFSAANGKNVISADKVEGKNKDGTYYYSIEGYFVNKQGSRTDIAFKNLQKREVPHQNSVYYEDDFGNEIYPQRTEIRLKYVKDNDVTELRYSLEGQIKEGAYENDYNKNYGHARIVVISEEEFLNKDGINVLKLQRDVGEATYFEIIWRHNDFVFNDLKIEHKEGRSQYRYVDKNMNEFIAYETFVLFKLSDMNEIYFLRRKTI